MTLPFDGAISRYLAEEAPEALRAAIMLVILVFCAIMVWIGYDYMQRMRFQLTPATRVPFSYIYAAIPAGFALLIVHLLLILKGFVTRGEYREAEALRRLWTEQPWRDQ